MMTNFVKEATHTGSVDSPVTQTRRNVVEAASTCPCCLGEQRCAEQSGHICWNWLPDCLPGSLLRAAAAPLQCNGLPLLLPSEASSHPHTGQSPTVRQLSQI